MKSRLNFLACSALWMRMLFSCHFRVVCCSTESREAREKCQTRRRLTHFSPVMWRAHHLATYSFIGYSAHEMSGRRRKHAVEPPPSRIFEPLARKRFHLFLSDLGHFHLWFWIKCRSDFWHFFLNATSVWTGADLKSEFTESQTKTRRLKVALVIETFWMKAVWFCVMILKIKLHTAV